MRQGLQSLLIKNRLVEIFVEEEEENPSEDMGYLAAEKARAEPGWARE